MKFLFDSQPFSFEVLRTAGFAAHGGADVGDVLASAAHIEEGDDPRSAAAEAFRRLSLEHRQVLLECQYRRLSVTEAAARLGVSSGTVKSRIHYALHAMRLTLEELDGK
jgi:DNA-directed RNA polymerase specialized sigma24 family protein